MQIFMVFDISSRSRSKRLSIFFAYLPMKGQGEWEGGSGAFRNGSCVG